VDTAPPLGRVREPPLAGGGILLPTGRKVSGKTKALVQDRLKTLHGDLESGVRTSVNYTVRRAAEDWLKKGLNGRSAKTIKKNENVIAPILAAIGARRLRELTAGDVHQALSVMALRYSTAAMAMGHNALTPAIRHAEARDLVGRNVDTPKGQTGRPSKSLILEQASAQLAAAQGTRMHAYISLCLATGILTEEARALRWEHVNLGDPAAKPPPGHRGSVALRTSPRRHEDREITPNAGPPPDGDGCTTCPQDAASRRSACRGQAVE
jgi:hypothetical protein